MGEDGFFKEKELESLEKKIDDLEKWRDEKVELNNFKNFLRKKINA